MLQYPCPYRIVSLLMLAHSYRKYLCAYEQSYTAAGILFSFIACQKSIISWHVGRIFISDTDDYIIANIICD